PISGDQVRKIMRKTALVNYTKRGGNIAGIGWAYHSSSSYELWKELGFAQFEDLSQRSFQAGPAPFDGLREPAGGAVTLKQGQLRSLSRLYTIESEFVDSLSDLRELLNQQQKIKPSTLQSRLNRVGRFLKKYDNADLGDNTVFAVFDQLVRLTVSESEAYA